MSSITCSKGTYADYIQILITEDPGEINRFVIDDTSGTNLMGLITPGVPYNYYPTVPPDKDVDRYFSYYVMYTWPTWILVGSDNGWTTGVDQSSLSSQSSSPSSISSHSSSSNSSLSSISSQSSMSSLSSKSSLSSVTQSSQSSISSQSSSSSTQELDLSTSSSTVSSESSSPSSQSSVSSSSISSLSSSSSSQSSSSSSFGDAIDLFYYLDQNKDVYLLYADAARGKSYLVFKTFGRVLGTPCGLAISYFTNEESSESSVSDISSETSRSSITQSTSSKSSLSVETSSSSSSSTSSLSLSSESSSSSSGKFKFSDGNVYILTKDKESNTAYVGIYNINGEIKGIISFSSGYDFLGLSVWPGNDNLLVATSTDNVHLIYINSGQILFYTVNFPFELAQGLNATDLVGTNECEFIACLKNTNEIIRFKINQSTRTVSIVETTAYQNLIGERRGVVVSSDTNVYFVRSDNEKSVVYKAVDGVDYKICTIPYTVYGMAYPIAGIATASVGTQLSDITISTRVYDKDGIYLNSDNSVFFGLLQPGQISDPKIVNILVEGVSSINNIKIGLVNMDVGNENVREVFMVETSPTINANLEMQHYFQGINSFEDYDSPYNVSVGVRDIGTSGKKIESEYVYLAVNVPAKYTTRGHAVYKWFFEYED